MDGPPRFFNPDNGLDRYRRNLPHWDQAGVVAFITFRLADSIPSGALADWNNQRRRWLVSRGKSGEGDLQKVMSELDADLRISYLREFGASFHRLLDDCRGSCVLRRPDCAKIVAEAFHHFDAERYSLGDYVVMPNHVHVLIAPLNGWGLTNILKSWKSFSARKINQLTGGKGQVWNRESFDHLVRDLSSLRRFESYIRENPEKARLRAGEFVLGRGSMPEA